MVIIIIEILFIITSFSRSCLEGRPTPFSITWQLFALSRVKFLIIKTITTTTTTTTAITIMVKTITTITIVTTIMIKITTFLLPRSCLLVRLFDNIFVSKEGNEFSCERSYSS